MRFSDNGYYVEKYLKCATCGMLVFGPGERRELNGKSTLYCSDWCIQWAKLRAANPGYFSLKIVQPKLPVEEARGPRPPRTAPPDLVMMNILDSTMVSICR
jgi:N-methylhydantoinase B